MGKDNITFHSQIWPAELLAYSGGGQGRPARRARRRSNLPTEVVSSEFLTMEGRKFSSSKRVVIYVRDMLARYQVDAFRYFVAAAGPENQDSDFTWAEFVRRTNDELVAGWGNLVNRTATMVAQELRGDPAAGDARPPRTGPCSTRVEAAFGTVGALIARHRQKQARRRGDARPSPRSTSTSRTPSPGSSRARTSASGSPPSCTSPPRRSATATPCSRRSCRTRPTRSTGCSAAPVTSSRCPRIDEVDDLDGGAGVPGDHR